MPRADQENWKPIEVARLLALVETERRYYQELFAVLPVAAAVLDRNLALIAVNREFRRRFAVDIAELGKLRLADLLPSAVLDEAVARVLRGESVRGEALVELGLHEPRRFRVGLQRTLSWQDSADDELLLTVDEVTVAAAPPPLPAPLVAWSLDESGENFVQVSGESEDRLGVPSEAWTTVAAWAENRVHPEDRGAYLHLHRELLRETGAGALEYRLIDAEAGVRSVREFISRAADGRCHGVTFEDRAAPRARRRDREQAKREALERLSGRLAHVANNLLMIIGGYAEELTASLDGEDPRRGDIEEISRAANRLAALTTQLSFFARPASVELREFRWSEWLSSLDAPREGMEETGDWIIEGAPELMAEVVRETRRVLAGHGVTETPQLALDECAREGHVEIRIPVAGLPPEALETLLEPFSGPREGTDPPLGLAGIAGRLERAGIAVEVDPVMPALCLRVCGRRAANQKEAPAPPRASILLVEDEDGIRALVEKTLARAGYEVLSAPWAEQALALCEGRGRPFDLLISDIVMPGAGGREVAAKLRAIWPGLRVLLISGHHDDALLQEEPPGGQTPERTLFLRKPFSLGELLRCVEALLGQSRAAAAGQS